MKLVNRFSKPQLSMFLAAVMLFWLPTAVLAQEEGGGGTAVTLSLLGLILLIIMVVGVIGAVGLGIIGVGYNSIRDEED